MANTLVGSAIAIVSVAPERDSGRIWYLRAVSAGMILMIAGIHLEVLEVDRRHAVLAREQAGDLLVADVAEGHEGLAELPAVHLLVAERLLELLRSDHVLLEQQLAELDGH